MIGEFAMKCLHTRTAAHVLHLKSRSYSQHMALAEFYEALEDLTDEYVEAYQGAFGLIEDFNARYTLPSDGQKLVNELCQYIDENVEELSVGEASLENILAEMCQLCQSTAYKLRFLK